MSPSFIQVNRDFSEEESKNLAAKVLSPGLLMIHDSSRCGQHHVSELSGWQQVVGPLLDVPDSNIKPGGDDSALVESAGQVDNDLASSVVINYLRTKYFYDRKIIIIR